MEKSTDLLNYLQESKVQYELIEHDPAFTAHDVARTSRVPENEMAKTIIVRTDSGFWMAVLRADQNIDMSALRKMLHVKELHLANEEDLNYLFPSCQVGAMPPFGNLYNVPVILDALLATDEHIAFNACTHSKVIRMSYGDFERLVRPRVDVFAKPPFVAKDLEFQ
jgi:Ala-tRNA(Pro) deacylase